jgi:putative transposase
VGTFHLLFVVELARRRVHIAGITIGPGQAWMKQIARNLTDAEEGFFNRKGELLIDRDAKFCEAFRQGLHGGDVESVRLPSHSPYGNAHLERFTRSLKEESMRPMIFFGERSLRRAVR